MKNLDDRHCPDCGLSVWISLNPNDSLEWSSASWLRRASKGAWIMALVQPLALVAYLVGMGASLLAFFNELDFDANADYRWAATQPTTLPIHAYVPQFSWGISIAMILIGIYYVLNAAGLLLLTSHEQRYPDRNRTIRTWSQVVSGVAAVFALVLIALAGLHIATHSPMNPLFGWLIKITCEVVFFASAACAWFCLRMVARRGRKSFLSRLCGYLLFLPVVPFLKAAPFIGIYFLAILAPLAELLPLIYIPASVYLFIRFALMMQAAIPEAEAAWASETRKN